MRCFTRREGSDGYNVDPDAVAIISTYDLVFGEVDR